MLEEEITKLYENLSLTDEDGTIHELSVEDRKEDEADVGGAPVRKEKPLEELCKEIDNGLLGSGNASLRSENGDPKTIELSVRRNTTVDHLKTLATISDFGPSLTQGKRAAVSSQDFNGKLNHCPAKLTNWSSSHFKNLGKQIEITNREIEHLYKSCEEAGVKKSIKALEVVVEGLQECKELYWKQRSRVDWLATGDRNSKYFHTRASTRKKKNSIARLFDCMDHFQDSKEGLAQVIHDYFG
ncbi:hypothetical protein Ddye_023993 [Dipteronia dyeriana]|uniref:Uncharacterized protein n=1 Tax=Dipteronia dyeriana TaxID=168575 RepID=A0AAD9TTY0_9ROSI|nr:hypothetical protein Ddye_023993 [Dipteronia dyeriana]